MDDAQEPLFGRTDYRDAPRARSGRHDQGVMSQVRHLGRNVLHMHGQAEVAFGGAGAGQYGAEKSRLIKLLTPDVKRRAARHRIEAHGQSERRRFGDRRLGILLAREVLNANHKKLYRIYRKEGQAVRRRRGRNRTNGTQRPMVLPSGPNQRWSLDFVSDALTDGRRFRTPCVFDNFTSEALAIVGDASLSGVRVGRKLGRIIARRGTPAMKVSDNGTELISHAIMRWQKGRCVE